MGIAFGALCLRVSASLHPTNGEAGHFSIGDFRWAFVAAGLLTLSSVIGYARLNRDAGSAIGGGALRVAGKGAD
jgi:hypothetical protein